MGSLDQSVAWAPRPFAFDLLTSLAATDSSLNQLTFLLSLTAAAAQAAPSLP